MSGVRRLATVVLLMAMVVANVGVCPGWAATPEARMSCCAENGMCPMRQGRSDAAKSGRAPTALTQAEADSCCASSEREESTTPDPGNVVAISHAVLGDAVVIPTRIPALVLRDRWRTEIPIPIAPVPRHVLLSVFLV
jgi:hypothetical protein